jgi:nitrate reductase NapAB chaperone NapD
MPIKSYLVYPMPDRVAELEASLRAFPECEITRAENQDLFVLVTDTPDEGAEKELERQLRRVDALQCLALVAAYRDPQ